MKQKEIEMLSDDKLLYNYDLYIDAFNRQKILLSCGLEYPAMYRSIKLTLVLIELEIIKRELVQMR